MKATFVRHVPVINPHQIWYGEHIDYDDESPPVSGQFNSIADMIEHDAQFISSPYPRALATAKPIMDKVKAKSANPLIIREEFKEQQYGVLEGKKHSEISTLEGTKNYFKDMWNHPPEGGESLFMFQNRVERGLNSLDITSTENVYIFSHGGVMMAAFAIATGQRMVDVFEQRKKGKAPSFTYLSCLSIEKDGAPSSPWVFKGNYLEGLPKSYQSP